MARSKKPKDASTIYAKKMDFMRAGYALWCPEPHSKSGEVQIGDVGCIDEGAFIRFFNVLPDAQPVPGWNGVPSFDVSEPLPPQASFIDERRSPAGAQVYVTERMVDMGVQGAVDV